LWNTYLGVDEWYDTALGDDDIAKELVQSISKPLSAELMGKNMSNLLFVIPDGKL
jgi:hypothetical protein